MKILSKILKRISSQKELINVHSFASESSLTEFAVEIRPNIKKIFTSDSPDSPCLPDEKSAEDWDKEDLKSKRHYLALAYLATQIPNTVSKQSRC